MKDKRLVIFVVLTIFLAPSVLCRDAAAAEQRSATLKKGTKMVIRLNKTLDSRTTKRGKWFMAELMEPVMYGKYAVIPKGSVIHAIVDRVKLPKMNITNASIKIVFDRIETPDGRSIPINARIKKDFDAVKALNQAGGAVGDHFGNQALNAATGGALTPFLIAENVRKAQEFMNKDKNVVMPAGAVLHISLKKPATVPLERGIAGRISDSEWQKAGEEYKKKRKAHRFDSLKKGAAEGMGLAVKTPLSQTLDEVNKVLEDKDSDP